MQDQPAGLLVDLGNTRARLHRGGDQPLADQVERDGMRSARKGRFDLGGVAIAHGGDDIVGRIGPHRRCAGLDRRERIDHRRQHLVVDRDRFRCGLRQHARGRNDSRDRLAGETHDLMCEQTPRRHRHRLAVRPLEDRQRRDGADIVLDQVGAGVNRFHAGHRGRRLGVDRDDFGVSMGRAQHMQPQRALLRLVVDELSLPGQQPEVFQTLDRLARTET